MSPTDTGGSLTDGVQNSWRKTESVLLRMNQAIATAIADEMRADPSIVVWGEDVGEAEGVFKATLGLHAEFGPARVRDTPISEMGFLGAAVGAAASGLRPIVEIMFVEFLGVALDQLVTEAAQLRYISGGGFGAPLTVRTTIGAGGGFGAQHSQTLERWFIGTPGLKVAVASGPRTAYGLTRSAIRDNDPVIVLEPKSLYAEREEFVPSPDQIIPLGTAELVAFGEDVTLIGLGSTVGTITRAARSANWSADVIDLLSTPWDWTTVLTSVRKTGRVVIVEENPHLGGWGADISSVIAETAFSDLRSPVVRVTAPDIPVPFPSSLEQMFLPSVSEVVAQVDHLIGSNTPLGSWWQREGVTR